MADDILKVSENVKVYKGDAGVKASVVLALPIESNRALVELSGTDTALDKRVRLHQKEEGNRGHAWTTPYKGEDWHTLRFEKDPWSGEQITLWIPGQRDGVRLAYDEEASGKVSADDLLNRHLRQVQEGVLAKLADFDRGERVAEQKEGFDSVRADAEKVCETSFEATVDFDAITDAQLMKYSVQSYFGAPLEAMRRLADSSEKAFYLPRIQQRVKRVSTTVGPRPTLTLRDGELRFTTAFESANLGDFALYVLRNALNQD